MTASSTFIGIVSVVFVLSTTSVRCAPVNGTSSTNRVPCESTGNGSAINYQDVRQRTLAFKETCENVYWNISQNRGSHIGSREDYRIPDFDDVSSHDNLATHYFVLEGFRRPLEAARDDEEQYQGTHNFFNELETLYQELQNVINEVRELACSNGSSGESQIAPMEDLGPLPSLDRDVTRQNRILTVLYYIQQYAPELHYGVLRLF